MVDPATHRSPRGSAQAPGISLKPSNFIFSNAQPNMSVLSCTHVKVLSRDPARFGRLGWHHAAPQSALPERHVGLVDGQVNEIRSIWLFGQRWGSSS